MTDEPKKVEEDKEEKENKVAETRKELEEMQMKVNEEFSNETENPTSPIIVERINQILHDAVADLPTEKIEPAPEVNVVERARQQIKDALAQMVAGEEVTGKVTGSLANRKRNWLIRYRLKNRHRSLERACTDYNRPRLSFFHRFFTVAANQFCGDFCPCVLTAFRANELEFRSFAFRLFAGGNDIAKQARYRWFL